MYCDCNAQADSNVYASDTGRPNVLFNIIMSRSGNCTTTIQPEIYDVDGKTGCTQTRGAHTLKHRYITFDKGNKSESVVVLFLKTMSSPTTIFETTANMSNAPGHFVED